MAESAKAAMRPTQSAATRDAPKSSAALAAVSEKTRATSGVTRKKAVHGAIPATFISETASRSEP